MREIRFRAKRKLNGEWVYGSFVKGESEDWDYIIPFEDIDDTLDYCKVRIISNTVGQYTGLNDKNGNPIYEGDILEFSDKWEWYRGSYGIKMRFADPERRKKLQEEYDKEPMERRAIEIPECYNWILSSEIQTYWQVIGNIYENPELLKP